MYYLSLLDISCFLFKKKTHCLIYLFPNDILMSYEKNISLIQIIIVITYNLLTTNYIMLLVENVYHIICM